MIGIAIGRYRVLELIGQGGMSSVYLGEHVLFGKRVAIKVLHDEYSRDARIVARFVDEARAAARMQHPGIVEIHDFGRHHDGRAYLIMELLHGESLAQRLRRAGPLPEPVVIEVIRQAASALASAHEAGVIHRDLKPGNLFLVRDGHKPWGLGVKVLDFGVARLADVKRVRLTLSGAVVGTPTYMAPEQCRDAREADHRADVYALGCIAFEMATGRPPFDAKGVGELMQMHNYTAPPLQLLEGALSAPVAQVVEAALVKARDERLQSMSAMVTALDTAVAQREAERLPVASRVTAPHDVVDLEGLEPDTLVDEPPPDMIAPKEGD
jgi:serine/threonine-protein kinase